MKYFKQIDLEGILWVVVLMAPLFVDPNVSHHFNFCLFNRLGFDFCLGCGLGRSIAFLYQGDLAQSFTAHPLGLVAVAVIAFRITTIVKNMMINLYRGGLYG